MEFPPQVPVTQENHYGSNFHETCWPEALIFVVKQCVSMIFQLLRFMDLCLDSNSVFGHLLASVIYKNSNQMYRHMVHVAFHIPKGCLHFFSLPPPSSLPFLSLIPTLPSPFGFLLVALLFSFCHHISDCLLLLCFLLSVPTVSSSSGSIHLVHRHQIGFSAWVSSVQMPPELPLSLLPLEQLQFTHWWWGFKPENLVSRGWKWRPRELVVHGGRALQLLSTL